MLLWLRVMVMVDQRRERRVLLHLEQAERAGDAGCVFLLLAHVLKMASFGTKLAKG